MKKPKKIKDPFYQRELEKYKKPIPSREYILKYLEKHKGLAKFGVIFSELNLKEDYERLALKRRLRAMARDGQILCNRKREYGLISKMDLVKGTVVNKRSKEAYVMPDIGKDKLYLNAEESRTLFHGDKVLAGISGKSTDGQKHALIVEVLERNTKTAVGRLQYSKGLYYLVPFDKRITTEIIIPEGALDGATVGQIVKAKINFPSAKLDKAVGEIDLIVGFDLKPGVEVEMAIHNYNLPHTFPENVLKSVAKLPKKVTHKSIVGRYDLRDFPFVTIDGDDAKDFDDAVYVEEHANGGYRLFVAIADVAHYVKPKSALDCEAVNRGNSVYFPEYVIPMLPKVLSNGLCSLNPYQDRLVLVCEAVINKQAKITKYEFYEAVINSHARLTYNQVAKFLTGDSSSLLNHADLSPHILDLYKLFKILHKQRVKRGAIEFDTTETRIIFGKNKKIKDIVPVVRNDAHKVIEECMLVANECAAKFLSKHKVGTLYRVHDAPDSDKISNLREFLSEMGLVIGHKKQDLTPLDYGKLLNQIQGRNDFQLIQTVLLRSLQQAVYSPKNKGHFGLAYEKYLHFTSPIRRYPDLLVHRAIKAIIHSSKKISKIGLPFDDENKMLNLGEHFSMTERRADDATRDAISWMKCQYLRAHLGQEFDGIITSVTSFGFFVELENIYIDGLVHVSSLTTDYFHFNAAKHVLVGERTNKIYRLGDKIRVRLVKVVVDERKVDLEIIEDEKRKKGKKSKKRR